MDLSQDLHNTTEFCPHIDVFHRKYSNFVQIKRSLSQLTEICSTNLYGDDFVPGEVSQLSGFPD